LADVFLSYAREDRELAGRLAEALVAEGFSVWWDALIESGSEFTRDTDAELKAARAVVVAWSQYSFGSVWVRDEAAVGRDGGKLFPVSLDGSEAPLGFRQFQIADFSKWRGGAGPEINELAAALRNRFGSPPKAMTRPQRKAPPLRLTQTLRRPLIAAALLAILAVGVSIALRTRAPVLVRDEIEIATFAANPDTPDRRAQAASYEASFRRRLTEIGVKNAPSGSELGRSEFILNGEISLEGDKESFAARMDDRASGATLWSFHGAPTRGAAWEANIFSFAINCALTRRTPKINLQTLSRYIAGCAGYLDGDFEAFYAAANEIHKTAPSDPTAIGFFAVGNIALGWGSARSQATHQSHVAEAQRLAKKALAIDPKNADALFALAFQYDDRDYANIERALKKSIEADVRGWGWGRGRYATLLAAVGRIDEAIDYGLQALQVRRSRSSLSVARHLASILEFDQSEALYNQHRPYDPEGVGKHELITAILYRDVRTAAELLEAATLDEIDRDCFVRVVAARNGTPYDAAAFAEKCGGLGEWSVRFYAVAGDVDAAYREMDKLLSSQARFFAPQILGPEMRAFLHDRRFFPLADRLGLVDYWLETDLWPDFCREPGLKFDCKSRAQEALARDQGVR
jgi:tetratricopeptide (TPR) repeat protein